MTPEQRERAEDFTRRHRIALLTMLFTDIVGSTGLKQTLGDRAAIALIQRHHTLIREALKLFSEAEEIDTAGDSFFCVFAKPSDAAHFALIVQRGVRELACETGYPVLDRIGIHVGEVFVHQRSESARDLFGIQIDTTARIMSLGGADQILLSRFAFDNARQILRGQDMKTLGELSWLNHGYYEMKGVEEPVEVCEVGEVGAAALLPPGDSEKAHRFHSPDAEPVLGWRPSAGQRVPNTQWTLERALGEGGFGEVWLARHETLKQQRVIKFCFRADRARSLKREVTLFRILRERVGEQRGIVTVHDVFFDEPPYYIVMDYVDGPNLAVWATAHAPLAEVPLATRLEIVAQVADALQVAHDAGVIHRDVKPSNILIAESQGESRVKLTDFGIGQVVNAEALAGVTKLGFTQTMMSSSNGTGTQLYMAPELLTGLPATTRSDLYSLGVVLYQLIVGDLARPVTGDWAEDIEDPLLREDLRKCLAGDAAKRFAGASQLALQLRSLDERRRQAEAERARVAALEKRAYRRGVVRMAAAAGAVVSVVLLLAGFAWMQARAARKNRDQAQSSAAAEAQARTQAESILTRMELQRAEDFADKNDTSGELAYLARVLRRDPTDAATANRLLSALRDRSHLLPALPPLAHDIAVDSIAFSPDGTKLVTATARGARIWDAHTGQLLVGPVAMETRYATAVHFTRDGKRFAVSGVDTRVFDSTTGDPVTELLVHQKRAPVGESVKAGSAFSPDGRLIATRSTDSKVIVWEVETGKVAIPPLQHGVDNKDYIWAAAFSLDGRWLLTGATDGKLLVWDVSTGSKAAEASMDGDVISKISMLPNGRHVAVGAAGGTVRLWDLQALKFLDWSIEIHSRLHGLAISDDGAAIFTADSEGMVRIWDAATGKSVGPPMDHRGDISGMILNSEHGRLVTVTSEPRVWVWGAQTANVLVAPRRLASSITASALTPDASRLALAGADGMVTLWRIAVTGAQPLWFDPGSIQMRAALATTGELIVTGEQNGTATIWDAHTGQRAGATIDHGATLWLVGFSPDGRKVITGGKDSTAKFWDLSDRRAPVWKFASGGYVSDAVFSTDGKRVCVNGAGQNARVWDLVTGKPLTENLGKYTQGGAFNADGSRVAVMADMSILKTWNAQGGEPGEGEARHKNKITEFKPDPKGHWLATASADGTARVWKFDPIEPLSPPMTHKNQVQSVAFSPDGELIVTASADHTAQVWRWKTGEALGVPLRHRAGIYDAAFSPDGQSIATASEDRTVRLWDAATGRPVSVPLEASGLPYRLQWTPDGQRLFAWNTGAPSIWEIPTTTSPAPGWLADWAEAVGGQRVDVNGQLRSVEFEEFRRLRDSLGQIVGEDLYARTARWFFATGLQRPISPDSKVTMDQFLGQTARHASRYTLQKLVQIAPADVRPKARMIITTANRAGTLDPAWAAKSVTFIEQAKTTAPNEWSVWLADSLLSEKQGRMEEARTAAARAAALAPDDYEPWSQLGDLLRQQGDDAKACDAFTRAIPTAENEPKVRQTLLEQRSAILVKLGRLPEARVDACAARGLPIRSPDATPAEIDLSLHYNMTLDQLSGGTAELAAMPLGLQVLAGTRFDIRGLLQLRSVGKVPRSSDSYPEEIGDIPIAQTCQRLRFLHASRSTYDATPRAIASYRIYYEDGSSETVPVLLGRDIADRYRFDDKTPPAPLVVAWSEQQKEVAGKPRATFLFKMTWQNPHPEKVVKSIDFISAKTDAAPFLVAITAE